MKSTRSRLVAASAPDRGAGADPRRPGDEPEERQKRWQETNARIDKGEYAGTTHVGKTGIERYYEDKADEATDARLR